MSEIKALTELVVNWLDRVYPHRTVNSSLLKLEEEIEELKRDPKGEVADVFIVLFDIAQATGVDIEEEIRKKMYINAHEREWNIDEETGKMHHIRQEGVDDGNKPTDD